MASRPYLLTQATQGLFLAENDRVTVTDLRSTNGTYVDGTEITSMQAYEVLPGSNIIFGDEHLAMFELRAVEEDESESAEKMASKKTEAPAASVES
jgi:pSer/pThr/pTyr-binding forkhead associated (FHA) protein